MDASILYKKYREASDKKKSQTVYAKIILEQVSVWLWTTFLLVEYFQVRKSRKIAEDEGIKVPTKVEDYVIRPPKLSSSLHQSFGSSVDVEENDNNLVSDDSLEKVKKLFTFMNLYYMCKLSSTI